MTSEASRARAGARFPALRRAPAARAVPAGRIGYDVRAARLLLHTFATREAFEEIRASGVLRADTSRAEPDFDAAYAWLRQQYRSRVSGGSGAPQLWFWARATRGFLIEQARGSRGSVLLTCRVPAERVLLSFHDEWHSVLNRQELGPRAEPESDMDTRMAEWEALSRAHALDALPIADWPADLRERMTRSWAQMFDLDSRSRKFFVQGVTEDLHADEVVDAVLLE